MSIVGLFCVVFDNEKGPVTKAIDFDQAYLDNPESTRHSDAHFGRYFTPEKDLCQTSVHIVDETDLEYCGVPLYLESPDYHRGCFRFCFVLSVSTKAEEMYLKAKAHFTCIM